MKTLRTSYSWTSMTLAVIAMVLTMTMLAPAQGGDNHAGIVKDWSTHHVRFSNPGTGEQAMQNGTYDRWLMLVTDPRYIMQQREGAVPEFTAAPRSADDSGMVFGRASVEETEVEVGAGLPSVPRDLNDISAFPGGVLPRGLAKGLIAPSGLPDGSNAVGGNPFLNHMKKDWALPMGSNGTTGLGEFPATYTTGGTNCSDFAVFNTGLAASSSQASVIAFNNLYSTCNGGTPTTYWAYNTGSSATAVTSVVLSLDGTQVALIQDVPYPVAATGTATANTGSVPTTGSTVTVGTVTYTWETTTNISTVNQMSTHGITLESEIAQTLYAALTGSRANCPSSNTTCISSSQTANSAVTPLFSSPAAAVTVTATCSAGTCGNSVAFTQSSSAAGFTLTPSTGDLSGGTGSAGVGGAALVLIRMAADGTLTSPFSPTTETPSNYPGCTAPCMTSVQFSGTLISTATGPTDTYSSPFYDYAHNVLYVGDDSGGLHKFTGIFSGTPTETITGGWPTAVNLDASLGGPVYDPGSTNVFVGDYLSSPTFPPPCGPGSGVGPCGYFYSINSSSGATIAKTAQLDYSFGIVDAPLLDPVEGEVYAFAGADDSTACSSGPCSAVYQFPVSFGSGATGTEAQVGAGYEFMLSGNFDNAYLSTNTGHLYVVGNTGAANNTLYQIPITNGVMGTSSVAGPAVATNYTDGYYTAGLQVTEFYNSNNHDYIFLSVLAYGVDTTKIPCPNQSLSIGCIIGFDVTSGTISATTAATGVLQESGGTSGIVVDNATSSASNIYFSTLLNQSCTGGTGGCAVQTSQTAP